MTKLLIANKFIMSKRRDFLKKTALTTSILTVGSGMISSSCQGKTNLKNQDQSKQMIEPKKPLVVSTWLNEKANVAAMDVLRKGGVAVDAVEAGVRVTEADPNDQSVGYGGRPDRDGNVTLDACIMDHKGEAGCVTYLQNIKHPVSVARLVMDETPHVMLSGAGALQFALEKGFTSENLLTEKSRKDWENWKVEAKYEPKANIERHDTIGMLTLDQNGNLGGACTTSGMAYKLAGRVGDSPIIGAGLFVDNEIGAATATGVGEAVMKTVGSFLVVELMRQGLSPFEACKQAVLRIVNKQQYKDIQVGYLAMNKQGEYGGFSILPGFAYTITDSSESAVSEALAYVN